MIPSEQQEWGGRAPFEQEETSGRSRSNRLLQLIGGWEKKGAQKTNTTGEGLTANLRWSSFSIKMSSLPLINIHNPGRKWGKAALGPSFPRCLPAEVNTLIRNKIHERKGVGFVSPGPWSSAASCSRLFSSSVLVWFCKRSQTALLSAEKWLSLWLNCFTLIGAVRRVCTIIVYNCWASFATITLYEYMSRLKDKPHWGSVVQMRLTDALLQLLLTLLCCKVRWLNYVIRAHTVPATGLLCCCSWLLKKRSRRDTCSSQASRICSFSPGSKVRVCGWASSMWAFTPSRLWEYCSSPHTMHTSSWLSGS